MCSVGDHEVSHEDTNAGDEGGTMQSIASKRDSRLRVLGARPGRLPERARLRDSIAGVLQGINREQFPQLTEGNGTPSVTYTTYAGRRVLTQAAVQGGLYEK